MTLGLALYFLLIGENVLVLIAAAGLRAVGTAVQGPAVGALLPQIVPQDKLMRVNGIFGSVQSIIGLASPVLSGVLMSLAPLYFIFFIDVVTAAAAILLLAVFLRVGKPERRDASGSGSYFKEMADGFRYIRSHRYLIPFFVYIAFVLILVSPAAFLTPLQTSRTYGADVWRLTAIEVLFSVGMLAGSGGARPLGGLSEPDADYAPVDVDHGALHAGARVRAAFLDVPCDNGGLRHRACVLQYPWNGDHPGACRG